MYFKAIIQGFLLDSSYMTLLKNLQYMLHLLKHVYVEPEEKNYKHILCKEKNQQWEQFQQIAQRCVLGMEPKLQRNILPLLCRGRGRSF